jgi:D-glycero-D-manno-heptose 1,7-bisphosphate phosphatase
MSAAVFLDRDGVLVRDVDLLSRIDDVYVLEGVPQALDLLHRVGFRLVVVSNQTVVARGLASEAEVHALHCHLQELLEQAGGPRLDGWYFCPHHPKATLIQYREVCQCRKPRPGLIHQAARGLGLDLRASFMVGDRITDIIAGARAGTRTVLVQTGKHLDPPIEMSEPLEAAIQPDHTCMDLREAAQWITDSA